jgi:hypothetical protein
MTAALALAGAMSVPPVAVATFLPIIEQAVLRQQQEREPNG